MSADSCESKGALQDLGLQSKTLLLYCCCTAALLLLYCRMQERRGNAGALQCGLQWRRWMRRLSKNTRRVTYADLR